MSNSQSLKALMVEKKITQAAIAESLRITRGHVNNVIAGRYPSRRVIDALAQALGMTPEALIEQYFKTAA